MAFSTFNSIGSIAKKKNAIPPTPSPGSDIIPTTGLLHYYKCDSEDVSGSTLKNQILGGTYSLTLVNTPNQTTNYKVGNGALTGGAVSTSGKYAYTTINNNFSNTAFTMSFWFYTSNSYVDTSMSIVYIYNASNIVNTCLDFRYSWANNCARFYLYDGGGNLIFDTSPSQDSIPLLFGINTWYYLTIVKNGNTTSFYVNGVDQTLLLTMYSGNTNYFLTYTTQRFSLLAYNGSTPITRRCYGSIDEFRIYNRALSNQEIKILYNYI